MTESTHDFDARLRAFLASAAARPTPPGLEDRLVAYVGRRRFAFLPRSVAAVAAVSVDDAFAAPSRRAARLGAATAALATVAVAVVGLASHTTITAPGGAGTFPAQQMTATASPVDLGAARAAAAGFFDPALPQCWTDPAVKGMAPPVDSYARCPVTPRLASYLRAQYGRYSDVSLITAFRKPAASPGLPTLPAEPSSVPAFTAPHYAVSVGTPTATSTGATVKVFAYGQTETYENDAILVHTSAGWRIDDILIYGRNVPYPSGHEPDPGAAPPWLYFRPEADGFPVSLYNPCTAPTATAPSTQGC